VRISQGEVFVFRKDLQKLAELRIKEAQDLLARKHPSGSYYLAGFSIECALKAVIARNFKANQIPDKKFVQQIYEGHDFKKLLSLANLKELEHGIDNNVRVGVNWATVCKWKVESRYEIKRLDEAKALLLAIQDPSDGILIWIKRFW